MFFPTPPLRPSLASHGASRDVCCGASREVSSGGACGGDELDEATGIAALTGLCSGDLCGRAGALAAGSASPSYFTSHCTCRWKCLPNVKPAWPEYEVCCPYLQESFQQSLQVSLQDPGRDNKAVFVRVRKYSVHVLHRRAPGAVQPTGRALVARRSICALSCWKVRHFIGEHRHPREVK